MVSENEDKGRYWFRLIGGAVLVIFGLIIVSKQIFFVDAVDFNGYVMLFGTEFIAAGYFFAHKEFKGFNAPR